MHHNYLSEIECQGCGFPGPELEHLPDEGAFYCPSCGHRTPDDLIADEEDDLPCRVCGCIESNACDDGCYWVEDDLCSACAELGDEGAQ